MMKCCKNGTCRTQKTLQIGEGQMRKQNMEIHSFKDDLRPDKIALMRSLAVMERNYSKDKIGTQP